MNPDNPLFETATGLRPSTSPDSAAQRAGAARASAIPDRRSRGRLLAAALALVVALSLGTGLVAFVDACAGGSSAHASTTHRTILERLSWTAVYEYFFPPDDR